VVKGYRRVEKPPVPHPVELSHRGKRPRLRAVAASLVGLAAASCAAPAHRHDTLFPAAEQQSELRPFSIQPFADVKLDDAIVRVVSDVTCSGTLIAEDLVLTAHHCVSARDAKGKVLSRDKDPREITIEIGDDDLPWAEVGVRVIVSPDCGYVSGVGDIAILVLERKLIGMVTYAPRLDGTPEANEILKPVGFGRCANSSPTKQRVRRDCEKDKDPKSCGDPVGGVARGFIVAQASICPGDSGGPVLVDRTDRGGVTSEVVGVISASAMDGDARTAGTSLFTRVDAWRKLFSAAREIADGASPSELPPFRSCD
jgi:hypothetical protein